MRIAIDVLLAIGVFFCLAGVVGLHRMPDAFSRMQSSTNISTLGILSVVLAAALYGGFVMKDVSMVVKLAVLGTFYLITTPVSSHAIARAAYKIKAFKKEDLVCDKYGEDLEDDEH